MSNTSDQEIGGVSIIPSARPSIHDHGYCPFAYSEAMGRYGIEKKNKREQKTLPNQSTDEVDNVFSKLSSPIGPSSLRQSNDNLSKSWNSNVQQTTEGTSNLLSRSLPATFSIHSNCSFEHEDEINLNEGQYDDILYQSANEDRLLENNGQIIVNRDTLLSNNGQVIHRRTPGTNGSNLNLSGSDIFHPSANQAVRLANKSPVNVSRRPSVTNGSNFNRSGSVSRHYSSTPLQSRQSKASQVEGSSKMVLPLLFLVGFIVTVASMFNTTNLTKPVIYDESRFYNDIDLLGNKYQIDEDTVLQMQTGIAAIVERQDTGSFMFVFNSEEGKFHRQEFNAFVNDISNTVSKYLRNESTPVHYTLVEGSSLDMNGPSELISTFREELGKTGVMLVKHVEAVPSTLAMAFHFYCDEYNPLVKKSAIFFTLNLAECEAAGKKPTHAVIEKCLTKKWNSVPPDSIGPLLTRVVSVVIDVTSAF